MNRNAAFQPSALVALLVIACSCRSYVEEVTPQGTVPPPPPRRTVEVAPTAWADDTPSPAIENPAGPAPELKFVDRPRIALLVNRRMVEHSEDWRGTGTALVVNQDRWKHGEGDDHRAARTTIHHAERTDTSAGLDGLPEAWLWALEDGFSAPLEQAGARLVDVASIMRLTALDQDSPTTERALEMGALKDHADIVVQILVTTNGRAPRSREFRGVATGVRTGTVLARTSTRDWPWSRRRRLMTVAVNSDGYTVGPEQGSLAVQSIARELSRDLTDHLCQAWEREHVEEDSTKEQSDAR